MREEKTKLISEVLLSVMPHLACPEELRELVQNETKSCDRFEDFIANFKKKNSEIKDPTKRTDGQIFLNELKRELMKSGSD